MSPFSGLLQVMPRQSATSSTEPADPAAKHPTATPPGSGQVMTMDAVSRPAGVAQQQQQRHSDQHKLSNMPTQPGLIGAAPEAEQLDTPQSPTTATNAAYMLTGLVSPVPPKQHLADASEAIGKATLQATSAGALRHPSHASPSLTIADNQPSFGNKQRSPSEPGQARLDKLLGLVPSNDDQLAAEQLLAASSSQSEQPAAGKDSDAQETLRQQGQSYISAENPRVIKAADMHLGKNQDDKAEGAPEAQKPQMTSGVLSPAHLHLSAARHNAAGNAAGQPLQETGGQATRSGLQKPPGRDKDGLLDAFAPVDQDDPADLNDAKGSTARQDLSPGQPFLSMATAGCFSNFQIAPGGQAQWRFLVSGQQVHSTELLFCTSPCHDYCFEVCLWSSLHA